MDPGFDDVVAALDALKARARAEIDALQQGVLGDAAEATARAFHERATRLERSIQAQIDAVKAARVLGVASTDLAGLVVVPVVVSPRDPTDAWGNYRTRTSMGDGTFSIGEAPPGRVAFAVQFGTEANGAFGHHSPFDDALRRGLPPGRYRFIVALVREEGQPAADRGS